MSLSQLVLARKLCRLLPDGSKVEQTEMGEWGHRQYWGLCGCVENVQSGGKRDTNCSDSVLQSLAAENGAGTIPHKFNFQLKINVEINVEVNIFFKKK